MKVNKPKVSVIIPVYNVEKYLADCLDSVVNQTLEEVEIICVNDGSTDSSESILKQYSCAYNNITVIKQENQGLSCARNAGILHARGEYIYFLDSDDRITANAMEEMYNLAHKDELDVLYIDGSVIYENEKLKEIFPQYETAYRRKSSYDAITSGLELFSHMVENGEYCVSTSLQLIKRGEHVRILDNLLRWKERKKAQKSEAELWENTERNMMRTLRRMRSSYRMQAQNR